MEPDDRRVQRASAQRGRRRDEILRVAAELFGRNGYFGTSISDVIDAAGISRGTFYLYFDHKDSLVLELLEQFTQRMMGAVRVVDPSGPDPTAEIYENVRRVVDVVFDDRHLTVMVLREGIGIRPEVDERLKKFYGFLQDMVGGALEKGARVGLIRKVNEPIVATALIGAVKELLLHHLVIAPERAPARTQVAETLLDFGLRGLLRDPTGKQ